VTLIYVISLFVVNRWWGYVITALVLGVYISLSHIPFSYIVRGLKPIVFILCFSVFFNLFADGNVLLEVAFLRITDKGLYKAITIGVRLILLIIGTSLMTYTTTPNELTDAMEKSLGFLKKIHLPVHEVAMMMSIALRFIPILVDETDKIMKAQMARGANFEEGSLIERAKNMVPLLVPLFISAFRRATDLAMAMEARCYHGGEGRTKMKPLHYQIIDMFVYYILGVYIVGIAFSTGSIKGGLICSILAFIYCLCQTIGWLTKRKDFSYEANKINCGL
jgi:energy-coupling factor transport system permease protein